MTDFGLEVRGLKETQRYFDQVARDIHGAPMVDAMQDATLLVTRDARKNAPVDRGILRASILPEVRSTAREVIGVVGSNQQHAPYMELGTKPHFPPLAALQVWARRHGVSAYLVARSIARKGIKARMFLRNAFISNVPAITRRLERAVKEIIG